MGLCKRQPIEISKAEKDIILTLLSVLTLLFIRIPATLLGIGTGGVPRGESRVIRAEHMLSNPEATTSPVKSPFDLTAGESEGFSHRSHNNNNNEQPSHLSGAFKYYLSSSSGAPASAPSLRRAI